MLMFISLGGEQVVLYRIVYMLLFLFFVTVFQVSYQLWIKVMYGFWLTVIIYSMLVLILIYSYQFEHFPEYWEHHLRIPVGFQKDIGLEVYQADPGTLFLKLLTPTFFLIITIIQLHYFHNEFIKLNEDNFTYSACTESTATLRCSRRRLILPLTAGSGLASRRSPTYLSTARDTSFSSLCSRSTP
ncbi:piezo-type mechanosensitive ion channel component-like [Ixodes scapularis]|uniref:piezo-type mechanosensitive ion channel component-like n=1 Tax=Ixodes scapularis TaxID=6945 RepID=UPI001C38ED36|nr:piezo-type mechanosensitive ion channel component-like [Ixodes scapularis]